ncbi:MAG: hypothetical protein HY099_02360 [Nitrospirae bacterium]|nr:hypothetical protein [Nitrospirota bacterium]
MKKELTELFDVRVGICHPEKGPGEAEGVYDAVNLLCLTVGPEPVSVVLTAPLGRLLPRAQKRLEIAYKQNKLQPPFLTTVSPKNLSPDRVKRVISQVIETLGSKSARDLFLLSRRTLGTPGVRAIIALRKIGFQIPVPEGEITTFQQRLFAKAIDELVRVTKNFKFIELFTVSQADAPQAIINAVLGVKVFGMFRRWLDNKRCWSLYMCDCLTTNFPSFCMKTDDCCSVISDSCPINHVGKSCGC